MTDTHMLDLIEHYKWNIQYICYVWNVHNQNIDVIGSTLRQAIEAALDEQAKWSIGK